MGDSPKWVKSKRRRKKRKKRERKKERLNTGDNNGQSMHGARKHAWSTQAAWAKRKKERGEKDRTMVITMARLRMAHASRLGQ